MIYDSNQILENFDGTLPIFSISNFVMFPRTSYNFNIFEPQYKDMITDILKSNKLFAINNKTKSKDSKICKTGTLCQIIESKKLDNGNYANVKVKALKNAMSENMVINTGTIIAKNTNENTIEEQMNLFFKCMEETWEKNQRMKFMN